MALDLVETAKQLSSSPRPVLVHLNADTTWLLSVPYPEHAPRTKRGRFNVLIDPWLRGPQVDQAGWFSKQWHAIESSVQHISQVEELLRLAEPECASPGDDPSISSFIDAVVVSHEFTDHCHEATLRELHADVPVFATTKAASLIQSWSYFKKVQEIPPFPIEGDWHETSSPPLPPWLGISRLINEKDALYYHSAVIICIENNKNEGEAVVYTPHGVEATSFSALTSTKPAIKILALLHGLHDVSLRFAAQLNLGAHNALKAQRLLQAKYWVGTHDEVKKGRGVVAAWLKRKPYTLSDALTHEAASMKQADAGVPFVQLDNGQLLVLV